MTLKKKASRGIPAAEAEATGQQSKAPQKLATTAKLLKSERQELKFSKKKHSLGVVSKSGRSEEDRDNGAAQSGAQQDGVLNGQNDSPAAEEQSREPDSDGAAAAKPEKRKPADEIESIFGSAKKKAAIGAGGLGAQKVDSKAKGIGSKVQGKNGKQKKVLKPVGSRKRTNDGLTVYTEDELGFARKDAGGTPLCPFDCQCCF